MAYAKQWNKLSEVPPPLDRQIYFLWTHPIMYGHIEAGCAFRRKLDDSIHYNYCFIGSLEPTHWFIDESEYPPLPEPGEPKEPEPKTCLKCKHFVDENHTGFYAMGCKRDGMMIPITAEIENLECFKGKSQEPEPPTVKDCIDHRTSKETDDEPEIRHDPQEDVTCEQCQTAVPPDRQWECPTCHIQFATCPHCDPDQKIPKPKEHESGGMTFMEAVAAMGKGKEVRRNSWNAIYAIHCDLRTGFISCGEECIFVTPTCADYEATDWEVV